MKFSTIVCDCPFAFDDKLTMSDVKRGAEANYPTLDIEQLKLLDIQSITEDSALLAFWVPSSLLQDGLDIMKAWGFRQTQTWIWVKTKKDTQKLLGGGTKIEDILGFGLGRIFRQCHEIVLIGVKGKIYEKLLNKSQRSVCFAENTKHSAKPEALQDRLELMFPVGNKIELFSRRERKGWVTVGNEISGTNFGSPSQMKEDIRDSIERLAVLEIEIL